MLYADEAWKGAVGVKSLRPNFKMKMMISSENTGKFTEDGKFSFTAYENRVGSNSIFSSIAGCRCIRDVTRVEPKENSKL